MKRYVLLFALFSSSLLIAQEGWQEIDKLPATLEVDAPEFDTEKKFQCKIDAHKEILYIKDIRQSKEGDFHFYQWLYEIPLADLDKESIYVVTDSDENTVKINIRTATNKKSIYTYWFQDDKVSSIRDGNIIWLGHWKLKDSNMAMLESLVETIKKELPAVDPNKKKLKITRSKMLYAAENVQLIGEKVDEIIPFMDGYSFGNIFEKQYFNERSTLLKATAKALSENGIHLKYPTPVIAYASDSGQVQNVFMVVDSKNRSISVIDQLKKPLVFKGDGAKKKYVLMIFPNKN